jgi:hypothetical protein
LKEKIGRAFLKGDYTNILQAGVRLSNERNVAAFAALRDVQRYQPPKSMIMGNASDKMPAELATELRALAHDLSNALETIVQATYLISQAGPSENSRRWVEMIDQASREAVKINNQLRQVLRSQS